MRVKAFSIDGLKPEDVQELRELMHISHWRLLEEVAGRAGHPRGGVHYHEATGLLVAQGEPEFIDVVTTIAEAFKETLAKRRVPQQR